MAKNPGDTHPLENTWSIWEHRATKNQGDWAGNMQKICTFATVEDFWAYYNHIPKPSAIFYDGQTRKRVGDRQLESLSIFKEGINPEWEDPVNAKGGEFSCRKTFDPVTLDKLWENLLMGIIGETIDWADHISGARVVDKSKGTRAVYKLELWVKSKEMDANETLKSNMLNVIFDGIEQKLMVDFEWKKH
uniref:Eukaryotic translation initiation factor 4E n=1 Tax=Fibrocapsa japonica TaxID=94617 RepID=A0A7S2XVT5_9STRA|eukprot:CAMPEP_0113943050 /NCGR_PEP_ID=MMETSP1339-20121228/18139_1 /TAXON_ID=94617 /ORGANISM="Fibrocapsa japonica" /LENGTH=189 /DNA_ID=CAMNT_0000947797 /DNA_START=62 /DNA_END=631 /DNA_ORIENTATION=+ /assembly_acc=CAM_ASM_000762